MHSIKFQLNFKLKNDETMQKKILKILKNYLKDLKISKKYIKKYLKSIKISKKILKNI